MSKLQIREVGCIRYGKVSYPYRIHWLCGLKEKIVLDKWPANLIEMKTGQWIEAIVERDITNSGKLIRVLEFKPIAPIPDMTKQQAADYFESLPVADLPNADLPIEEIVTKLAKEVPQKGWDKLPSDLTNNLDHYLYDKDDHDDV